MNKFNVFVIEPATIGTDPGKVAGSRPSAMRAQNSVTVNDFKKTVDRMFPAELESIRAVRRFVRGLAEGAFFPSQTVDDIELCASELATNAIEYGRASGFHLSVQDLGDRIVLRVFSPRSEALPGVKNPKAEELAGRGLQIVSRLSDALTIEQCSGQVVVVCTFFRGVPNDTSFDREYT